MKNLFLLALLFPASLFAQSRHILAEGSGKDLYIQHTASAKENFYSIGRMYNISPKEIAPFNNLKLENGLTIGQTIKVPLKENNFTQSNSVGVDESAIPLYHTVAANESLMKVSSRYNNVSLASLRSWNKISGETVPAGKDIIVGYLKVKKDGAAVVQNVPAPAPAVKETTVEKVAETPVTVAKSEPVVKKAAPVQSTPVPSSSSVKGGGLFKTLYTESGRQETGKAGIFKSTSGFEDGKYYCLYNKADQNTVIKITNKTTGKSVYAKVLDVIPDLKQNEDMVVRLSNAAGEALGSGENDFECIVNY